MRDYPQTPGDREELAQLNAAPWMVNILKLNPAYTSWGPGECYMTAETSESKGFEGACYFATWADMQADLDEVDTRNIVANFYFQLHRKAANCAACARTGYAPLAREVYRAFYDLEGTGTRWCDAITADETQALVDADRVNQGDLTLAELTARFNAANVRTSPFSEYDHDGINCCILVEARCKRLGYEIRCPVCQGQGFVYVDPAAHLQLVLWLLHPRKGASRGVVVQDIQQEDLPGVYKFLRKAAAQNAKRFAKVPRKP